MCSVDMPAGQSQVEHEGAEAPGLPRISPLLLSDVQAADALCMSRSQLWALDSEERIPAPIRLSTRLTRWRTDELRAWVNAGMPPRDRWQWPPVDPAKRKRGEN